uniref:TIR domain-containing protein n=1 Tax=Bracon brevicornis TaxID=1563983 RepID=A0A6V7K689_9HYME
MLLTTIWGYQCPEGMGCRPCQPLPDNEFEVQCSTTNWNAMFLVRFKPNEWVKIDCHNSPNWSDFHLGTIQQIEKAKGIAFRMCKLPQSVDLGEIVSQLVVSPIDELTFQSYDNLTLTLNKETLAKFRNVRRLTLTSNKLANVTSDLLHGFDNLTILNLRDNHLRSLPGAFLDVPSLTAIELGNNLLETLGPDAFDKLENLKLLNLWNNRLVSIEPGTFDNLKSLESLDLHLNKLRMLPQNIFSKLTRLRTINLSQNNFSSEHLPEDLLRNCSSLEVVTFWENRRNLTTLPNGFFEGLKNLTVVKMKRNGLLYLPEDLFRGATGLRNLSMERNYIETLPKGIFNDCRNLGTISLSFNEISELPAGIFAALHKLEVLDLSINHISTISPGLFEGLNNLKVLNMERNGMKTIEPDALRPLFQLRIAKFSYNQLTLEHSSRYRIDDEFGPKSVFHDIRSNIEELHLAHNNVSSIFGDWLLALNLRLVDLKYNKFTTLVAGDFDFLSNKINVDLSRNEVTSIYLRMAEAFLDSSITAREVIINIEHNPINCDCGIYDLLRYRQGRMHSNVQGRFHLKMKNLTCATPKDLKGTAVETLKSETLQCLIEDPGAHNATCPSSCECYIRPENRAYIIDCASKGLTAPPNSLEPPQGLHVELNMSYNAIAKMADMRKNGYNLVTSLALAHNRIEEVPLTSISRDLTLLDVSYNNISRLNSQVLDYLKNSTKLGFLKLQGNPFVGDCEAKDFLSFIQSKITKFPELQDITFIDRETPAFELTPDELCPTVIGWIIGACIGIALLGLILGTLAALYYRYQQEIKVWLYSKGWCLWFVTEDELDKDKLYDAFISFSHKDEDFVTNTLIKKLEEGPKPFKLCVHYRDWLAGDWIPAQIIRSVEDSRRTIVVLSPSFLESVWGKMEFRTAHQQALSEGRARVIIVLYGDIENMENLDPELKAYLSMNTYVKWGDPWFWQKLKYALPHQDAWVEEKKKKNKKRKLTVYETQQPNIQIAGDKKDLIEHVVPSVTT